MELKGSTKTLSEDKERISEAVGHILIADDDPDFRRLLVHRAERMGLRIVQAREGRQAMQALRHNDFDVLVLDLYMPHHTGIEVFQAARKRDPDVQAIVLTGNASVDSAVDALRAGAYDYMMKPLESLAVFELSLTRALEHRYLLRENARLFAEVHRLAMTDPLTGLFNRHKLNETLGAEVERGLRYNRPLSAIMVDLDDLKEINDRYGHPVGDEVLVHVAQGIRSQIRRVDIATRYGGDEFLVILPEADRREAEKVAARIAQQIDSIEVTVDPAVSASIGVAQLSHDLADADHFIRHVDQALYEAKRAGGGCIRIAASTNGHS
jgi:diguanylate cyclase (GGDEF)-like protein